MRSLNSKNYDTDKSKYMVSVYEELLGPYADRDIRLLELGIHHGGSLLMWRDYFERGRIAGLDFLPVSLDDPSGRIHIYQGEQQDLRLLDRIRAEVAPGGFDFVIDDASHVAEFTRKSFWRILRNHLKPGGWYFIEDWGTGYWNSWPDGRHYRGANHLHGMVGFVKELIDECGAGDVTFPGLGISPQRRPEIAEIRVVPALVAVRKPPADFDLPA